MNPFSLLFTLTILSISFHTQASARDYYVSTTGISKAKGTLEDPMSSIQSAINLMRAGDTCYIRGGVYHEIVKLNDKRGFPKNPITITNYQNEKVTMDGTINLKTK